MMGVSMVAFIGMPVLLAAIYGADVRRSYAAGGAPAWCPLAMTMLTTFVRLKVMAGIIWVAASLAFNAAPPAEPCAVWNRRHSSRWRRSRWVGCSAWQCATRPISR